LTWVVYAAVYIGSHQAVSITRRPWVRINRTSHTSAVCRCCQIPKCLACTITPTLRKTTRKPARCSLTCICQSNCCRRYLLTFVDSMAFAQRTVLNQVLLIQVASSARVVIKLTNRMRCKHKYYAMKTKGEGVCCIKLNRCRSRKN